jgi:hypothetical protein
MTMASIFNRTVTAEKIGKAIEREQTALGKVLASLGEVGTALDAAIGNGKDTDALYNQLANLQLQTKAREGTIARLQAEYQGALEAEHRAARDRELAAYQALAEKRLTEIESDAETLVSQLLAAVAAGDALNAKISNIGAGAPTGTAGRGYPVAFSAERIFAATSAARHHGTYSAALRSALEEFSSNSRSLRGEVLAGISAAHRANRPPSVDLAPEPARRRFDLVNGERVDPHGVPLDADGKALPIKTFKANRIPERSDAFAEA